MFEQAAGAPYNTVVVRGGARVDYRKIHLYDSFGYKESDVLAAGPIEPAAFDLDGTTVGVMTCYDLRFPELARRLVDAGAEVIVVPAAWVAGPRKVEHWTTLLRARAIENTVYVVGVGQPAPRYSGHSTVIGPLGDVLVEGGDDAEILTTGLDLDAVGRGPPHQPVARQPAPVASPSVSRAASRRRADPPGRRVADKPPRRSAPGRTGHGLGLVAWSAPRPRLGRCPGRCPARVRRRLGSPTPARSRPVRRTPGGWRRAPAAGR